MPEKKISFYIPSLTFKEIEEKISTIPALILPIGGMEPIGDCCALGVLNECTSTISKCIANRCKILLAPLLQYSNTTPYRAFAGSIGVKKNIFESLICGLIKDCSSWGIKWIFIVDGRFDSVDTIKRAVLRTEKRKSEIIKIFVFNWQNDSAIQSFIKPYIKGVELGRKEFAIISIASYINQSLVYPEERKKSLKSLCSENEYRRWFKLGRDPEKFRKLFQNCSTSRIENDINPQFGKKMLEYIVEYYGKIVNEIIA